ncbi:MAG: hypothetical protein HYT41_02525 [Candidatus Sungbacteria bacterium]|nr:hypothetical protein [Candidatus Sungbacteria bacterium]
MEIVPLGPDSYAQYIQKREKYTDEITECDRRIARVLLTDRCISGGIILCALVSLAGLPLQSRFVQIAGAFATAVMAVASSCYDVSGSVSDIWAERHRAEDNIRILDETWVLFNK